MNNSVFVAYFLNGLYVFGKTETMVVFEIRIIVDGLFELLRIVVDEDSILLYLVSIDFEELDLIFLFYYLADIFRRFVFIFLFHWI